ncbi:hypothetical protein BAUCODRAFT_331185 [Baudoinia panamericana UAMH 10762]|uniref:Uncharacterized protein n=1 Tax=Baudoinia panamericana (strain UAMH 10762) TaxID=717646 RepID=M2MI18_BAUPA|nr:uncharacterized protein BAUCODRAFT_331185 [Baudoinia panamericana UAMH 10762]EMC90908.1 hypothetical protein BAUCODRAFT_331185 [Baudoinia panamericana UAMH 10762]
MWIAVSQEALGICISEGIKGTTVEDIAAYLDSRIAIPPLLSLYLRRTWRLRNTFLGFRGVCGRLHQPSWQLTEPSSTTLSTSSLAAGASAMMNVAAQFPNSRMERPVCASSLYGH